LRRFAAFFRPSHSNRSSAQCTYDVRIVARGEGAALYIASPPNCAQIGAGDSPCSLGSTRPSVSQGVARHQDLSQGRTVDRGLRAAGGRRAGGGGGAGRGGESPAGARLRQGHRAAGEDGSAGRRDPRALRRARATESAAAGGRDRPALGCPADATAAVARDARGGAEPAGLCAAAPASRDPAAHPVVGASTRRRHRRADGVD
jgi:hypothetical protein